MRALGACVIAVGTSALAAAGIATAAVTVPFQINPAPFGNPNGSFDVPPSNCVAVLGEQTGSVTISGGKPGGWGCIIYSEVNWLNLSTGATGTARMSDGLNGFPPEATLNTGSGQVVLTLRPTTGTTTPGFAGFYVP
ncbi:hypothetical protein [Rhodococcus chondri]|uniref:Secreted protein n=1 Tax=Rhodococcus chondri TaxID=3065941 RepID=A0ABU7JTT7_9NOCA|nr:hypothetical protein [Rhodococcus sp. CC-R104]MEE2033428.1 hypothetical protein [Rhodococcus sp. CC-R104]